MKDEVDVLIVGAGAAGLAAGIFAAEAAADTRFRIALFDGAKKIGAKMLISGGGRCNVTNDSVSYNDFNGLRHVIRNILAAFNEQSTSQWFSSLGVKLKCEKGGKVFPVSNSAHSVLDALIGRCHELGVEIFSEHRVTMLTLLDSHATGSGPARNFLVQHGRGTLSAQRVIMATGGRSLPRTGSDGLGWQIVHDLGHTVTPTHPALVPFVLDPSMFHANLSGLSQDVELITIVNGRVLDRRSGSMLWTHLGISGPVAMDCSRIWTTAIAAGGSVEVRCSLWPGAGFDVVNAWILAQARAKPRLSLGKALARRLPERMAGSLCQWCGIEPGTPVGQLSHALRRRLAHAITGFTLPLKQDRGWNHAEVTAGGVPLNEIDYQTMESRKVPGLYLIGEMLDCDGRIGGFNFQWAWTTGFIAGRAAVASLRSTLERPHGT